MAALVLVALLVGASGEVWAQTPPTAAERQEIRRLGYEGVKDYQAGRYAIAVEKLQRAYTALPVPSLGLWSARALVKRGRLLEAAARYESAMGLPLPDKKRHVHAQAQRDAAEERELLLARIPTLTVVVDGPATNLEVTLDREPLSLAQLDQPMPIDPGEHVVAARRGDRRAEKTVTLIEKDQRRVVLTLPEPVPEPLPAIPAPAPVVVPAPAPLPAPPPEAPPPEESDLSAWWITGFGLTGATAIVAGATWLAAADRHDDFAALNGQIASGTVRAEDPNAATVVQARADAADDTRRLSGLAIGFGVGAGVLAVTTGVLLGVDLSGERAAVGLGPGGLRLRL